MNVKILLASFFLVFLAELGDKTQLTALAFCTSSRSPWSVFIGTSLALICATALAVVCGEALTRVVPVRVLHLVSAVMFVLVGLILLINLARKAPEKEALDAPAIGGATGGAISAFVGRQAVAFEEDLADFVRDMVEKVGDDALRDSLQALHNNHLNHAQALTELGTNMSTDQTRKLDEDIARGNPEELLNSLRRASEDTTEDDAMGRIIQRQEAAAEFYIALARLIRFHEARDLLRGLAMEEIRLAQDLCTLTRHEQADKPEDTV